MGRNSKSKKSSRKTNSSFNRGDQISVHCRKLSDSALSGGLNTIAVSPAQFPQALDYADAFTMYRVTRLRYRLIPVSGMTATMVAAYIAGVTDTAPTTLTILGILPHAAILGATQTTPTQWCTVPANCLRSYMPWFKTIVGTTDVAEEVQGNIYVRGGSTDSTLLEIDAEFAFRQPVSTSMTPMERGRAAVAQERERLLRILSGDPVSPAPASQGPTDKESRTGSTELPSKKLFGIPRV